LVVVGGGWWLVVVFFHTLSSLVFKSLTLGCSCSLALFFRCSVLVCFLARSIARYQTLTVADLILLWQKGKEMHGVGEKDTSVAIFTLLCSTIQHQSGPLLKAMIGMIHKDVFPPHTDPTNSFKDNVGYNAVVAMLSLIRNNWTLVREIGLCCTCWWYSLCSSTDHIMNIQARITLNVEFIRTCIF
jgi:hypothetical protein